MVSAQKRHRSRPLLDRVIMKTFRDTLATALVAVYLILLIGGAVYLTYNANGIGLLIVLAGARRLVILVLEYYFDRRNPPKSRRKRKPRRKSAR